MSTHSDLQSVVEVSFYFDTSIDSFSQSHKDQSTVYGMYEYGMCENCFTGWLLSEPSEPSARLVNGVCDVCNNFCAFCEQERQTEPVIINNHSYGVCKHCFHTLYNEHSQKIKIYVNETVIYLTCQCECGETTSHFNFGECDACHTLGNRINTSSENEQILVCVSCAVRYMQNLAN